METPEKDEQDTSQAPEVDETPEQESDESRELTDETLGVVSGGAVAPVNISFN